MDGQSTPGTISTQVAHQKQGGMGPGTQRASGQPIWSLREQHSPRVAAVSDAPQPGVTARVWTASTAGVMTPEEAWRARLAPLLGMALRQKGPTGMAPRWRAPHTDWDEELGFVLKLTTRTRRDGHVYKRWVWDKGGLQGTSETPWPPVKAGKGGRTRLHQPPRASARGDKGTLPLPLEG